MKINEWDFEWQDYYTFKKLVKIPNGYRLYSKHYFDNTASNPHNPNSPPITVFSNTGTNDEMLFDGMMYLLYQPGDELIDMQAIMDGDPLFNTGVHESKMHEFSLNINVFPNPFNDEISFKYVINEHASVSIEISDILGKQVFKTNLGMQDHGYHEWKWEKTTKTPSGIYFYKIKANNHSYEGKIIKQN